MARRLQAATCYLRPAFGRGGSLSLVAAEFGGLLWRRPRPILSNGHLSLQTGCRLNTNERHLSTRCREGLRRLERASSWSASRAHEHTRAPLNGSGRASATLTIDGGSGDEAARPRSWPLERSLSSVCVCLFASLARARLPDNKQQLEQPISWRRSEVTHCGRARYSLAFALAFG